MGLLPLLYDLSVDVETQYIISQLDAMCIFQAQGNN